jgi:hypothetical protein
MIVSTDYLRIAVSKSDALKEKYPDKRSWFVSPTGENVDAGHNHKQFVADHPELFNGQDEFDVLDDGWIKVGDFGNVTGFKNEFYIDGFDLDNSQLKAAQEIYRLSGGRNNVRLQLFSWGGTIPGSEFFAASSVDDLRKAVYRQSRIRGYVTASYESEWFKRQFPDKRSWWISPYGDVYDAGHNHDWFVEEHPEIFGTDDDELMEDFGWVRVGSMGQEFSVRAESLSKKKLEEVQKLYRITNKPYVVIDVGGRAGRITKDEFLQANSMTDLLKALRVRSSSRRASGDDRAWLISPQGEAYSCGFLHERCGSINKELFKIARKIYPRIDESDVVSFLRNDGWARFGYFEDPSTAYLDGRSLTGPIFRKFKEMMMSLKMPDNTRVTLQDDEFLWRDFKFFDSMMDAKKFLRRGQVGSSRRQATTPGRALWVSPDGKVFDGFLTHDQFIKENQDLLKSMGAGGKSDDGLVRMGWGQIGRLGSIIYLYCEHLNDVLFNALRKVAAEMDWINTVDITEFSTDKTRRMKRQDFLYMDGPGDVRRVPVYARKRASLPKSRNFLMGVDLESLPWPLRQAFDLLNLAGKKDRLSANQVASVFQANDEFLQDHLGRTATELIRDLNAYFQYGQLKEQID